MRALQPPNLTICFRKALLVTAIFIHLAHSKLILNLTICWPSSAESKTQTCGTGELRALLLGLSISNEKGDALEEDLKYWMKEFDQDEDNVIGFDEFCNVLKK